VNMDKIEQGMSLILKGLGIDPRDQNFSDTPERYAKALYEMFNPQETEWATFEESFNDFILLRGHKMWSLCPHHMLPVHFTVSLAYIPNGHVLGLSKLARLLDECNSGPLLQERFTKLAVDKVLEICPSAKGASCLIHGTHSCLSMRGVKSAADFVTYKLSGVFETDRDLEHRFFTLARRSNA